MKDINVISVSGGKDSTATLLLALERGIENIRAVFADTGHEHAQTYAYLDYLEQKTGVKIERIKPDFSAQIAHKREVVQTKWRAELPATLMKDKPGAWRLKPGYKKVIEGDIGGDGEDLLLFLKTPTKEKLPWPGVPAEPVAPYEIAFSGPFIWSPAIPGLAESEALDKTERIVESALDALVPTGIPFLDLCLWKGRFPSSQARFCTTELKVFPIQQQVFAPLLADPNVGDIYSWQGVRADESKSRALLPESDEPEPGLFNFRPILKWTAAEVFDFHRKHGVDWNPLYEQGMGRVGCMPCIHCNKAELYEISSRFPEEIARVLKWEKLVAQASKRGLSTFFAPQFAPGNPGGTPMAGAVEWSKTSRGGRQYDLIATDDGKACASAYGLCE